MTAQFAGIASDAPISTSLSYVITYDAYCVAYLALTWRALPRMRPEDLTAWAAQVDAQPRRFRDLLLGRPVGFAIPVSAAVTGFGAAAWALPQAAELDPDRTVVLGHALLSFAFNTGVLALTFSVLVR